MKTNILTVIIWLSCIFLMQANTTVVEFVNVTPSNFSAMNDVYIPYTADICEDGEIVSTAELWIRKDEIGPFYYLVPVKMQPDYSTDPEPIKFSCTTFEYKSNTIYVPMKLYREARQKGYRSNVHDILVVSK